MKDTREADRQQLVETVQDWLAEAVVDPQAHRLRNVALLGPESRNGYRYTPEAMSAAVPLYEDRPVFLNHPTGNGPTARKVQDYAGKIVEARFEGGRVRGDVQLVGPNRAWVTDLAASRPAEIGMSHVVIARRGSDEQGNPVVESIEKVLSVDVVAFPATTASFAESTQTTGPDQELRELREEKQELEELLEETETLLKAAERRLALERKLKDARLPVVLLTERWLQRMADLDPDQQDVEIAERTRLGRLLQVELPSSREKPAPVAAVDNTQARRLFVQAVRGN